MGTRKNERARRRNACLPRARSFSLSPTTSKRLLRRLKIMKQKRRFKILVQETNLFQGLMKLKQRKTLSPLGIISSRDVRKQRELFTKITNQRLWWLTKQHRFWIIMAIYHFSKPAFTIIFLFLFEYSYYYYYLIIFEI